MAATAAPINGSALMIRISTDSGTSWDILGYAQSATLSRTTETRDITSKTTCGWRALGIANRSWSLSGDGFAAYATVAGEINPYELHTLWASRQEIDVEFTVWDCEQADVNPGDPTYSGKGFITSLEETGGVEDNGTYSFTIEGNGVLNNGINP